MKDNGNIDIRYEKDKISVKSMGYRSDILNVLCHVLASECRKAVKDERQYKRLGREVLHALEELLDEAGQEAHTAITISGALAELLWRGMP